MTRPDRSRDRWPRWTRSTPTLAGEPVDPRHAELAELALLLADERPGDRPPRSRRLLDERVERRFAAALRAAVRGSGVRVRARGRGGSGVPAQRARDRRGGAVASRWVVVVSSEANVASRAIASCRLGGRPSTCGASPAAKAAGFARGATGSRSRGSAAAPSSRRVSSVGPASAVVFQPADSRCSRPRHGRKVIQGAQLALTTAPSRIDAVAQEVFNVVGQQNGIVKQLDRDRDGRTRRLRPVPAQRPERGHGADDGRLSRACAMRRVDLANRHDARTSTTSTGPTSARAGRRPGAADLAAQAARERRDHADADRQPHGADPRRRRRRSRATRPRCNALSHRIELQPGHVTINAGPLPVPVQRHSGGGFTHRQGRARRGPGPDGGGRGRADRARGAAAGRAAGRRSAGGSRRRVRRRRREQALDSV